MIGESANQKRSPRTSQSDGQSEAFTKDKSIGQANQKGSPRKSQSYGPIRSVHNRTSRSYGPIKSRSPRREGAPLVQSDSSGRKQGGRLVTPDGSISPTNRIHRSDYFWSDYLRTDFLRTDFPFGQKPPDRTVTRMITDCRCDAFNKPFGRTIHQVGIVG